ncbi:exosporium leader peptide [Bacillus cereus VD115]|nr:exosporium leader peptide [Bacillus cereus VD115]
MDELLSSAALNPDSIGPTLPPKQPFQFPTGPTGSTGATGSTGLTLFPHPLAPDPEPIEIPENTNNFLILEVFVPIKSPNDRVLLNATIGTDLDIHLPSDGSASFTVNAITYQLFRNNVLLTSSSVSGKYQVGSSMDITYTFNSTFTWGDFSGNPIFPTDPVLYRIVANIGDFSETILSALVGNRGFSTIKQHGDPI